MIVSEPFRSRAFPSARSVKTEGPAATGLVREVGLWEVIVVASI
jgi:hypothetical protein